MQKVGFGDLELLCIKVTYFSRIVPRRAKKGTYSGNAYPEEYGKTYVLFEKSPLLDHTIWRRKEEEGSSSVAYVQIRRCAKEGEGVGK